MSEQLFLRNGRWVPYSQLYKTSSITLAKGDTKKDLAFFKEKKEFLQSLSKEELKQIAIGLGIKVRGFFSVPKIIKEILIKEQ